MGEFRITIEASALEANGNGCQRDAKAGETIAGCGLLSCPDCVTGDFLRRLHQCADLKSATIEHWPKADSADVVTDAYDVTGTSAPAPEVGPDIELCTMPSYTRTRAGSF